MLKGAAAGARRREVSTDNITGIILWAYNLWECYSYETRYNSVRR
jgi:hypothetical protein